MKRLAIAYCGGPGGVVAQVELFDDNSYEGGAVKGKAKTTIPLADAKIDSLSPPSTPSDSLRQGSVVSGTWPRSGFEFHITSGAEQHEFKCDSEESRASWIKPLGLLILFPQAHIPEEPLNDPIKDSFRSKLSAEELKADSVWPIFVFADELSLRLNIIGLHSLVLRGGVPNQTVGTLEIVSPADMKNPIVTWERDKLRRTGKTGNFVFVEIGRRCKGGPGLVWLYTGVEQAQSLRETLHNFLFHGEGKAIGQQKKPIYNTPEPSMDSLPPSYNRRSSTSTSSGYNSQTNLITSPATNYGSLSLHSETLPPTIQHPAGSLDQEGVEVGGGGKGHTQDRCHTMAICHASQGSVGSNIGGAHGGGNEYELMIHPASMNGPMYKESDYVYMHSTQSPAKYSNYDFVAPASSLSTISEVERPTPYENHPLPQELKGATPVTFQPKYENVGAAKSSRSGSIHFDVYENVLSNERANERIYENLQQTMSPDVLHIDRDYTM